MIRVFLRMGGILFQDYLIRYSIRYLISNYSGCRQRRRHENFGLQMGRPPISRTSHCNIQFVGSLVISLLKKIQTKIYHNNSPITGNLWLHVNVLNQHGEILNHDKTQDGSSL